MTDNDEVMLGVMVLLGVIESEGVPAFVTVWLPDDVNINVVLGLPVAESEPLPLGVFVWVIVGLLVAQAVVDGDAPLLNDCVGEIVGEGDDDGVVEISGVANAVPEFEIDDSNEGVTDGEAPSESVDDGDDVAVIVPDCVETVVRDGDGVGVGSGVGVCVEDTAFVGVVVALGVSVAVRVAPVVGDDDGVGNGAPVIAYNRLSGDVVVM